LLHLPRVFLKGNIMDNMKEFDRKNIIGGSDIAAICGMSRWGTALSLWAEKTGRIEQPDLSDNEAVEMGTDLEDFVAKKFMQRSGKKIRRDRRMFKHPVYSHFVAHIDRRVVGTDELLECKTCSAWKAKEWEDEEIPQEYICQVQWYLGILGMSKGYIAVLIGGQKFVWKEIDFESELFELMIEKAKKFWQMVKDDMPPVAIAGDKDTLSDLYPGEKDTELDLDFFLEDDIAELEEKISEFENTKKEIKIITKREETLQNQITQIMQNCEVANLPHYKITWKSQTTNRLDTKKLKAENQDIYDKYCVESEKRVFKVLEKKEEKKNG